MIARDHNLVGTRLPRLEKHYGDEGSWCFCIVNFAWLCKGERCEGWAGYHPSIKRSILGLAKQPREFATHHHDVSAVAQHVARWYAHCVVAIMRVTDEHNSRAAARLGRNGRTILIQAEGHIKRGVLHENTGGVRGTWGIFYGLPKGPEPIRHRGRTAGGGAGLYPVRIKRS